MTDTLSALPQLQALNPQPSSRRNGKIARLPKQTRDTINRMLDDGIPYHVIIPFSLLLAIAALARAPRKLLIVGFAAIAIAACCNVVLGMYHAGVEWHWWAGPADCSGPLTDLRSGGSLIDQLHGVHVVRCDEAAWRFLGLSLAGYNVLISLALAMIYHRTNFRAKLLLHSPHDGIIRGALACAAVSLRQRRRDPGTHVARLRCR